MTEQQLMIFESGTGQVEVRLQGETVWLSQEQMTLLFGRERSVITKHLRNVFAEGELQQNSVCAKFAHTAADGKTYQVEHYNLNVIISVGYRVKSVQGTHFRQWATRVLREHLTQGYTLNRQRFEQNAAELEAALALVKKAAAAEISRDEGRGLVDVIARYTHTFLWLQRYDEGLLTAPVGSPGGLLPTHVEALAGIAQLKADLNLLYFIIKNHPFSDGNKRIGSYLFVDFLARNGQLLRDGQPVINDVGLAALALLVAESDPSAKEVMVRLIENMLAPSQPRPK